MHKLSLVLFALCAGLINAHSYSYSSPALGGALFGGASYYQSAPAFGYQNGHYAAAPAFGYQSGHYAAAAPAFGYQSGHYAAAAPAFGYQSGHYAAAAPAFAYQAGHYASPARTTVLNGPASVQNVYEERARVTPGESYVYKVQAPPKIHKEVVQVAQVVNQPKVLYSEVVAPAKVDKEVVVQEPNPQVVQVQPQVHKESLVLVQQKAKPQVFVAQKRRDTVAKRTEYEQHKFRTVHGDHQAQIQVVGGQQFNAPSAIYTHGAQHLALPTPSAAITHVSKFQSPSVTVVNHNNDAGRQGELNIQSSNADLPLSFSSSSSFGGIKN